MLRTAGAPLPPVRNWLPIDWSASAAVALHGSWSALVYVNTPRRFAGGPIRTARQYEETLSAVESCLRQARDPETDEPLFTEVHSTSREWNFDPEQLGLPDVVAEPAPGYFVDPTGCGPRWLTPGNSLAAVHQGPGLLLGSVAGIEAGRHAAANLMDVAPTVLELLGIETPASMQGRPLPAMVPARRSGSTSHGTDRASVRFPAQAARKWA